MPEPISLNVEEAGDPSGAPMLFVHGFLSCNDQWMPNREALGRRLRLIMVELPGHGGSPAPTSIEGYGPDAVLSAIEAIRTDRDIDRWWVTGQSLGGAVAMNCALRHPEQTVGLVFTNSRAAFGIPRRERVAGAGSSAPEVGGLVPRDLPVHPINATRFPPDVKAALVEAADAISPEAITAIGVHRDSWRCIDDLHRLEMPVMLVNGRWEKAFQPHVADAATSIANLEIVELEGGHSINIEQAEAFNDAVLRFVDRHSPA